MQVKIMAAAAMAAGLLAGCASVTQGTTQAITVTAVCEGRIVQDANCEVANDKGRWEVKTPGSVVVQKAYGDLVAVCRKGGASGTSKFVSKANDGAWGNIFVGGLIGYAIDSSSGAGFTYPTELPVVLVPPCPAS